MKRCCVDGCKKEARADSYCWKHHNRSIKYGDPLAGPQYYGNLSPQERFMKYVDKTAKNGCWHWIGAIDKGYGKFRIDDKNVYAHRASVLFFHKPNVDFSKLLVCHKCDNTMCVNPDHLFLGTHQDNVDDKMQKGRHVSTKGVDSPHAKLTEENVLYIRDCEKSAEQLAIEFNVSTSNINAIRSGKRWKHVGGKIVVISNHVSGENHPMKKLDEEKVRYIRNSDKKTRDIAMELGISYVTAYEVRKGKTWKHVI
jgi:hypothetical protein